MLKTVLVVEDDEELNDVLHYNLTREGYRVLQAWDGREAMEIIRKDKPALVLLDLMLPGASGTDILQFIRDDEALAPTPVVVYTARGAWEDFDEVRQYNVEGYFTKPYSTGDVVRHIRKVLDEHTPTGALSAS